MMEFTRTTREVEIQAVLTEDLHSYLEQNVAGFRGLVHREGQTYAVVDNDGAQDSVVLNHVAIAVA